MKLTRYSVVSKRFLFALASAPILCSVALFGALPAVAQVPADPAPAAKIGKPEKKSSALKKIPARLAHLGHFKKAKKARPVDARMNSSDTPGTIATSVSDVKLKKIPATKDKPENVSVAQ